MLRSLQDIEKQKEREKTEKKQANNKNIHSIRNIVLGQFQKELSIISQHSELTFQENELLTINYELFKFEDNQVVFLQKQNKYYCNISGELAYILYFLKNFIGEVEVRMEICPNSYNRQFTANFKVILYTNLIKRPIGLPKNQIEKDALKEYRKYTKYTKKLFSDYLQLDVVQDRAIDLQQRNQRNVNENIKQINMNALSNSEIEKEGDTDSDQEDKDQFEKYRIKIQDLTSKVQNADMQINQIRMLLKMTHENRQNCSKEEYKNKSDIELQLLISEKQEYRDIKDQQLDDITTKKREIYKRLRQKIDEKLKKQKDIYDPFQNIVELENKKNKKSAQNTNNNQESKIIDPTNQNYENNDLEKSNQYKLDRNEEIEIDLQQTPKEFSKKTNLKEYQKEALSWMLVRENKIQSSDISRILETQYNTLHPHWSQYALEERQKNISYKYVYVNFYTGQVSIDFPKIFNNSCGGILADEMGLGKTVMTLSLILANPRPDQEYAQKQARSSKLNIITKTKSKKKKPQSNKVYEDTDSEVDDDYDDSFINDSDEESVGTQSEDEDDIDLPLHLKLHKDMFKQEKKEEKKKKKQLKKQQQQKTKTKKLKKSKKNNQMDDDDSVELTQTESIYQTQQPKTKEEKIQLLVSQKNKSQTTNVIKDSDSDSYQLSEGSIFYDSQEEDDSDKENQEPLTEQQINQKKLGKAILKAGLHTKKRTYISQANMEVQKSKVQGGTLVIVPPTLLGQWQRETRHHVQPGNLSWIQFYGPMEKRYSLELQFFDIVFTSYDLLTLDFDESEKKEKREDHLRKKLFSINWHRVILDEAHLISNINAQRTKAVLALSAKNKWCLTGTPIQNKLESLYPIIAFIELSPWDIKSQFYDTIVKPQKQDNKRVIKVLQGILKPVMLRRTKHSKNRNGEKIIELPKKIHHEYELKLTDQEQEFYNGVFKQGLKKFIKLIKTKKKGTFQSTFALITRMRQCVNHQVLVTKKYNPFKKWEGPEGVKQKVLKFVDQLSDQDLANEYNYDINMNPSIFNNEGEKIDTTHLFEANYYKKNQRSNRDLEEYANQKEQQTKNINEEEEDNQKNQKNDKFMNEEHSDESSEDEDDEFDGNTKEILLKNLACNEFQYCEICSNELDSLQVTKCQHVMCKTCWKSLFDQVDKKHHTVCPYCRFILRKQKEDALLLKKDQAFQLQKEDLEIKSSKIEGVLQKILEIIQNNPKDKIVVFTYFRGTQELLKYWLSQKHKIKIAILNGSQNQDEKEFQLERFQEQEVKVFISTLTAGNVGLNLTQANHCILVSPWWNSNTELQAEERIHRLGQTKEVNVYRFYMKKTIEMRIREIQEQKKELIDLALRTDVGSSNFQLSIQDFKRLFDGFDADQIVQEDINTKKSKKLKIQRN